MTESVKSFEHFVKEGDTKLDLEDYHGAIESYSNALELDPGAVSVLTLRAIC